jgi:hypothetical protein
MAEMYGSIHFPEINSIIVPDIERRYRCVMGNVIAHEWICAKAVGVKACGCVRQKS